jgi:LuxR family transcriptional regulator, maltose regulon positive regulatory protein
MVTYAAEKAVQVRTPAVSVGIPILASKITAPSVPDWVVPRPRITKLIAQGTRWCPLTVVSGPAGAGKTTALALWAATQPGPVAWVCLDAYDNRPEVFWSHFVAALRRSGVDLPAVRSPASRGRAGDRVFLLGLAAALAAQAPAVTLVLDDLHLLTDPRVLDGLDYVLRNVGAGLRLAVSARMDPLPLHRYRLAGELTEILAGDLAFTVPEAGQLMTRHGITLTAESLESLTRRTEGWAAGLRLAAISMGTAPDPGQFVTELVTDASPVTGYLVAEVLDPQPPAVRELLLSTSILEHVSGEAASQLTGNEQAGTILPALAHANAFVLPAGPGWYRYHPLFAEVLQLKLKREHPDRLASLYRRAARWYESNGQIADAVRHAARGGDWPLAASIVIDGLAISEIIEPRGSSLLAEEFKDMPPGQAWTEPAPHLVGAAIALSAGQPQSAVDALDAADGILERLPADQGAEGRLAAALIRLAVARRTGDLAAAAAAVARAEVLVSNLPDAKLARHRRIRARLLSGRGAVELWSGQLDQAARTLELGVTAATAPGAEGESDDCLGHLALVEALRGRLRRAAALAARATAGQAANEPRPAAAHRSPAALVALALVHLERNELREAHGRLGQADAALGVTPDKLITAVARLAAAHGGLAQGRTALTAEIAARARSGWPLPAWLEQRLSQAESWAHAAAGDIEAALAAARRCGQESSPEAAVARARAQVAAADPENATRALAPVLSAGSGAPERVRLHAHLADARLSYDRGDRAHGRTALASALRLAEPEQLRLPFVIERGWIERVLRSDFELARAHRRLFAPGSGHDQRPAPPGSREQGPVRALEPLTERELEVLRHVSGLLSSAEVAREMHISVNTVKTHLDHIYRKLATSRRSEAVRRARQLHLI